MTTLAQDLSDSATQMWVNAAVAETDRSEEYTIDTEVVRVTAYSTTVMEGLSPERTDYDTLWQIERGVGPTTVASHTAGATLTPFPGEGGGAAEPGTVVVTPGAEVDIAAALEAAPTAADGTNPFVTRTDALPRTISASGPDDANGNRTYEAQDGAASTLTTLSGGSVDARTLTSALGAGSAIHDLVSTVEDGVVSHNVEIAATGTGAVEAKLDMEGGAGGLTATRTLTATSGDGDVDIDTVLTASSDGNATGLTSLNAPGAGDVAGGFVADGGSGGVNLLLNATTATGVAEVGALARYTDSTPDKFAGMSAISDAVSARMGFNGSTPVEPGFVEDATDEASAVTRLNELLAFLRLRGDLSD